MFEDKSKVNLFSEDKHIYFFYVIVKLLRKFMFWVKLVTCNFPNSAKDYYFEKKITVYKKCFIKCPIVYVL